MHPNNKSHRLLLLLCLLSTAILAQDQLIELPPPDLGALILEDKSFGNPRFSAPLPLDIAPATAPEEYNNPEGNIQLWTRSFSIPQAHGLALFLDEINLPEGAEIIVSNGSNERRFTQADVSVEKRLFSDFLAGENITLTYRGPLPETTPFHIFRIDHVYRPELWQGGIQKGFGSANDCHVNANCGEANAWDDEKSGAAKIVVIVAEGAGYCSGSLINNTSRDGRPYILTGFHCMDGFTPLYDLWEAHFDYVAPDCDTPTEEPTPIVYRSMEFRAGRFETDFLLLEIVDPMFAAEDHYFGGWDRSEGDVIGQVFHFHHPQGDIQKYSRTDGIGMQINSSSISWNSGRTTPAEHHFECFTTVGSFEPGSSGSAFYDSNRRIRGQLNGGNASCTPGQTEAFVGRFNLSWGEGDTITTRLKEWLDPLGVDSMTLDSESLITKRFVSGQVFNEGEPAVGATITFGWLGGSADFVTDENGRYRGERPADIGTFGISGTFKPDGPLTEQVDVGDIINIRRHIIGLSTLDPQRLLACDVNNSGTLRVSDITKITRVILEIATWDARPNWILLPVGFPLDPIPTSPGGPIGIALNNIGEHDVPVDFFVVKTGDATGN
jgi:hypothetical protein